MYMDQLKITYYYHTKFLLFWKSLIASTLIFYSYETATATAVATVATATTSENIYPLDYIFQSPSRP